MRSPLLLSLFLGLFTAACVDSQAKISKEVCTNTTDDDGDGKTDCSDPDCFSFEACCVDRCEEGSSLCSNAGVMTCTRASTGCRALSAPVACTGGTVCSGGSCVLTCTDRCNAGAKQCIAAGASAECQQLASGCYDWVVGETCGNDALCSGGTCGPLAACTSQCSVGAGRCTPSGAVQTCVSQGNGCSDWAFPSMCNAGFVCSQGACVQSTVTPDGGACTEECTTSGMIVCDGTSGTRACGNFDTDSCLEWGTPVACQSGEQCANGSCSPSTTCSNDCSPMGAAQCDVSGGTRSCGNFDADACLEWSTVTACGRTEACSGGTCTSVCTDECALATSTCSSTTQVRTCGNTDPDPCYELSAPVNCLPTENCTNNACSACTNECPAMGDRECSGAGFRSCGNFDTDSCFEWSTVSTCQAGEVCMTGTCGLPCTDECSSSGATRCMGSLVQTCGNSDADSCLEWSASVACAGGGTCTANVCQAANAPEVRLITPQGTVQSTQGQLHTMLADATPAPGRTLTRVEFFANGVKQGETTTSPHQYAYTVPASATTGSAISLQAQAVDNLGTRGFSQFATLSVLNNVPVAAFTATVVNTNVVQVDASAVSDTETATAALQVCWDWDNDATCDTPYSTTKLETHTFTASGTYTIGMKVRDAAAQISSTTRQVSFADVQYLGGANVTTTTWYGTIVVTGDLTVPAGNTVTIAPGTQVLFVRQDQDMNMIGDNTLTVNGALVVNGTAAAPVLFSGQGAVGKVPGAWDRVVLAGAGSTIDYAVVEYADVGLDVRGNAVVRNTIVRQSRGDCVLLTNADAAAFTDTTTTLCGNDGVEVGGGSTGVTFTRHTSTLNGARGFLVNGTSAVTVDASSSETNALDGVFVQNSTFNLANSTVAGNTGTGLTYFGTAGGTVTRNQVRTNGKEGVRVEDDASGAPSPVMNLNNIHSNAVASSNTAELVAVSNSTSCTVYNTGTSTTYTAPAGKTIRRVRVSYDETDISSNYVTGAVQTGAGANVTSFSADVTNQWVYMPAGATTVRVTVTDNGYSSTTDTISINQLELYGTGGAADVVAATLSGTVDLQNNYLGTFPNVLSRVSMSRNTALDLQGFVGVLFDSTWNRGPYQSGTVNTATWSGTVFITGNVNIPAGQTVSVSPSAQVRFVKHDQNGDGDGDFTLTATGKLNSAGTITTPVSFGALAPATGNAFQRVVLAGTGANTSAWTHTTVANGRTAIELRGASTLTNVSVTGGTSTAVFLTQAHNAALVDLVVSNATGVGLLLDNSDTVTLTRPDIRGGGSTGLEIGNGSTGVIVSRAFLGTNVNGLVVWGTSTAAVDDSTIRDNTADGVGVYDSSPTIQYSLITYNGGNGFDIRGSGTTTARYNVVKFNNDAALAVWTTAAGSPTPVFQSSNVYANGVMGSYRSSQVAPGISTSCTVYNTGTSTTYTAPAGKTIRRVRVSYDETDISSNYVTGAVQTGTGANVVSYSADVTNQWVYMPAGSTTVRVTVTDNGYSSTTDTISASLVELEGQEATGIEAMVATDTGVSDARYNYWTATITDVPMKIYETRVGATDYSGYTGAEYPSGTVMQVGPRP